jgi:hypothetical protein
MDVLYAFPKISHYERHIRSIALKNGLAENWINDAAKAFLDFLPPGYEKRLITIDGGFKFLKLKVLSKIDFFILKLSSMRDIDLDDISNLILNRNELTILNNAIEHISAIDNKIALNMDLFVKEYEMLNKDKLK